MSQLYVSLRDLRMVQKRLLVSLVLELLVLSPTFRSVVLADDSVTSSAMPALQSLLDVAWRDPPKEIDVVVLQQRTYRPVDSVAERVFVEKMLRTMPDNHPTTILKKNNPEEFQKLIDTTIREAHERREARKRFRYRYVTTDWFGPEPPRFRRDLLKFTADSPTEESLSVVESWVNSGDLVDGKYESLSYEAGANRLDRFLDGEKAHWHNGEMWRLWVGSSHLTVFLRSESGELNVADNRLIRSKEKQAKLIRGMHEKLVVEEAADELQGELCWKIAFKSKDSPDYAAIVAWVKRVSPSQLLQVDGFDSSSGRLVSRYSMKDHDSDGLAHYWKEEIFHEDGFVESNEINVLSVINPAETSVDVFQKDAFKSLFTIVHYADKIATFGPNGAYSEVPLKGVSLQKKPTGRWILFFVNAIVLLFAVFVVVNRERKRTARHLAADDSLIN